MKRAAASLIVLAVLAASCGDDDTGGTTTVITGVSGSIHLSGGFAGVDETWVLESDGTVFGPNGYTGAIGPEVRAVLEAAVDAADFFDLDDEYLPDDLCCDRFLYELTLTRAGVTHTVTTLDAAEAPESLFALIQAFLGAVRPS